MPYCNLSCLDMSQKLLSHTETGYVGSDTNLLNLLPKDTITTCFQSFTSSLVDCVDLENTVVRSKKIRIYSKNRQLARKYLGLSRWWYNRTINYLNQPDTKAPLYDVRKVVQKGDDIPEWAMDCPQRIREHAMADACNAVKNAKVKCQKTGKFQKVSFRAKRDPIQSFSFDKASLDQNFVFGSKKFGRVEQVVIEL